MGEPDHDEVLTTPRGGVATALDLSGQRFGSLVALTYYTANGLRRWHCACDCGRTRDVHTGNLRSGQVTRCLYCGPDYTRKRREEFPPGRQLGDLTIIGPLDAMAHSFKVRCTCGKRTTRTCRALRVGGSQNCGSCWDKFNYSRKKYIIFGVELMAYEIYENFGIPVQVFQERVRRGVSPEDAALTPYKFVTSIKKEIREAIRASPLSTGEAARHFKVSSSTIMKIRREK